MKKAYVFPGQGAQFVGMGKELLENNPNASSYFEKANQILGYDIKQIMTEGTIEELTRTDVTQPAIFIHSVLTAMSETAQPDMVAGHSLGEFSALVFAGGMNFEDGLALVYLRGKAMQEACEIENSTMAAVLGLGDDDVISCCNTVDEVVIAANFNCPGQIVISGSIKGVEEASKLLADKGAKRVLPLKVAGAFHSPLMEPARLKLKQAVDKVQLSTPSCPIYQNYTAKPTTDTDEIKNNLVLQLVNSVRWTESVNNMINDGATTFKELGPGRALAGMIKKINREVEIV